ncbi:hypothetical protein E2493_03370 [Sphingomonas parva]|uniref:Secreted protein n=1 Tax=Sphingomonas parva TaxID=2555898 RepID=A0A4Y8ZUI3_9SPHN|nr:hypothetical protein [Sphingomonas parva]TFI59670.1 hypothetical protein E2493_03370 [Sphingomonas parva]
MPSSLSLLALAPLMLFGSQAPMARNASDTILVSLCLGGQVPIHIPRRDRDGPQGATACHAAAVMPKKKRA